MIRHVVLFRLHPGHDRSAVERWAIGLQGLVGVVAGLRTLSQGPDVMHLDRSWDHAIVADFDSIDALNGYAAHPAHLELIAMSATFSREISSVDFEIV